MCPLEAMLCCILAEAGMVSLCCQKSSYLPKKFPWVCINCKLLSAVLMRLEAHLDRKSTRLNSSHANISYAVFCLKKKNSSLSLPFHSPHYLTSFFNSSSIPSPSPFSLTLLHYLFLLLPLSTPHIT